MQEIQVQSLARELRSHMLHAAAAAAAKSLQSCPTLCDPTDGSPPGSSVSGILQARTLEWVVISFPNAWKWKAKVKSFSRARHLATPWTTAYQAPPSMGFSRHEYWNGVPLKARCEKVMIHHILKYRFWDWFLLVTNLPSNAGDVHSSPGQGTKIPHATRQLLTLWVTIKTWHSHKQIYIKK